MSEESDATDLATVKKLLSEYVQSVAEMVDADWHDGWDEQGEELCHYYDDLAKTAKAVYRITVVHGTGFQHCHVVRHGVIDASTHRNGLHIGTRVGHNLFKIFASNTRKYNVVCMCLSVCCV